MSAAKRISVSNIERAAREIDPVFIHSPQFVNEPLNDVLGCDLTLKVETMNPIRSFKGRGADFFFRENREMVLSRQVVCATAGNFGQAVAYAAARNGVKPIVYCATNANPLKVERMKRLGADVRQAGENFDASKEAAKEYCAQHGAYFVEDGRDVAISEGAGSIAVELMNGQAFDSIVVPLGNGALISGVATWIKHVQPSVRVIGVSSRGADAMEASWKSNSVIERPSVDTIADGIAVRTPVPEALADMRGVVDDVVLVDESSILTAMRTLFVTSGIVGEPAGVAGIAALLEHASLRRGRVATIVCGSNLTDDQMKRWLFP